MITREFDLTIRVPQQDYIDTGIKLVQNDQDVYILNLRVTDGITDIDYNQVDHATITFALANGAVVQSDPERLAISSGGITYEMGTTEISCPGKVTASIQLFDEDGGRLTTARFQFEVVADLITPGAVQSESRFPILQQLVADVEQLKQDIVDLQIPDNSIMDEKLSNAAGQIKQRFASHMADNVNLKTVHGLRIEAGTWTPTIAGYTVAGSNTYANQTGIYYKIGRLVHCHGRVALSTKDGAMNGGIRIAGLPFAASVGYHSINFGQVSYFDYAENSIGLMGYAIGNEIPLYEAVDNGNRLVVLPTQIKDNTDFLFSIVYTTV